MEYKDKKIQKAKEEGKIPVNWDELTLRQKNNVMNNDNLFFIYWENIK